MIDESRQSSLRQLGISREQSLFQAKQVRFPGRSIWLGLGFTSHGSSNGSDGQRSVKAGGDGGVNQLFLDNSPAIELDQRIVIPRRLWNGMPIQGVEKFLESLAIFSGGFQPRGKSILIPGEKSGGQLPKSCQGGQKSKTIIKSFMVGLQFEVIPGSPISNCAILLIVRAVAKSYSLISCFEGIFLF
ncbi:MAG: hypothetical protein ACKO23_06235 [Gemmataceae bacterium]